MFKKGYQPKGKLGSGSRFKAVSGSVASQYVTKGYSPKKAAKIGAAVSAKAAVKKYGQKKLTSLSVKGKQ